MKKDKVIDIVTDLDFNIDKKELSNPIIRYASRGIIFDKSGNLAVINKEAKNEYKLPGGGIEDGERPEEAFLREVLEETGCQVEISDYLGTIIEEKSLTNFKQISYVFVGKVLKNTKVLNLTEKEIKENTILIWKDIKTAYELIKNCQENIIGSMFDTKYQSLFMAKRDEKILSYYLKNKKSRKK